MRTVSTTQTARLGKQGKEIKMNSITLVNDFHNTSVTLRMKSACPTKSQVKRAKKTLCTGDRASKRNPNGGCACSGVMGMRGVQSAKVIGQEYLDGELVPCFA